MVELAQACKSIQVAATVEINGALAQMLDAEITPPLLVVNQKNKNIPNSGLKQRNGKQRIVQIIMITKKTLKTFVKVTLEINFVVNSRA